MNERQHLGKVSNAPISDLDLVPWDRGPIVVSLNCSEFTSHCPVTGQPDFASILIRYVPGDSIVETKSLKLFLWSYRDRREFNESLVMDIFEQFKSQVSPNGLEVCGEFNPRGGIRVTARKVWGVLSD